MTDTVKPLLEISFLDLKPVLQNLLAGELTVRALPDDCARGIATLFVGVEGFEGLWIPGEDSPIEEIRVFLTQALDSVGRGKDNRRTDPDPRQENSGQSVRKFLSALVENASEENIARVRVQLEKSLQPFNLAKADLNMAVKHLLRSPYFYTSDDSAPIFDFFSKINGIVTRLGRVLGYKEGSKEEKALFARYVEAAMKHPSLFCQRPDTLFANLIGVHEVGGDERTGIVTRLGRVLGYEEGSKEEKALFARYVDAAMKQPQLFYLHPDTIFANLIGVHEVGGDERTGIVTRLGRALGYKEGSKEEQALFARYVDAAMKKPQLFCQHPDTLFANLIGVHEVGGEERTGIVTRLGRVLGYEDGSKEEQALFARYVEAAMKQQQLFCQHPDTIFANLIGVHEVGGEERTGIVTRLGRALGYKEGSKEEQALFARYVEAAMKQPQLFYQHPDTIFANLIGVHEVGGDERTGIVTRLGRALGYKEGSKEEQALFARYVDAAMKQPQLFCLHPDTIFANLIGVHEVGGDERTGIVTRLGSALGYKEGSKEEQALFARYVDAVVKQPQLFYLHPDTLFAKITLVFNLGKELKSNLGFKEVVGFLLERPTKLCYSEDVYYLNYLTIKVARQNPDSNLLSRLTYVRGRAEELFSNAVGEFGNEEGATKLTSMLTHAGILSKKRAAKKAAGEEAGLAI